MRVSHLNGLKALEATLRTGSFRAAAEELGVTPAAVGQQVRTLEDFLERQLLIRSTRGVAPTEHALRIQHRLSSNFASIAEILDQLRGKRRPNQLAVTMPSSFAENWFAERLSDFYGRQPDIDLRLTATNRMLDLLREDYDFAIRYCPETDEVFEEHVLFGDAVLPVCTPQFARKHRLTPRRKALDGVPLIHLVDRTPDPGWPDWPMWGKRFGFTGKGLDQGLRLRKFSSGLSVATSNQGLVLCGLVEAFRALQTGSLVAPFGYPSGYPTGFRYRLVSVRGRDFSPPQTGFKTWLLKQASHFRKEAGRLSHEL